MALLTTAISTAIAIAAVAAFPALYRRQTKFARAKTTNDGNNYIDYSNFVFWMIYAISGIFIALGVGVYMFSDEPYAGIFFIVLGLTFLLPTLLLKRADTSVSWTSKYITGAKSGYSLKKNRILWSDIVSAKYHANHTIQIIDILGKSVFWSIYYQGWHEIISELQRRRPDIQIENFGD